MSHSLLSTSSFDHLNSILDPTPRSVFSTSSAMLELQDPIQQRGQVKASAAPASDNTLSTAQNLGTLNDTKAQPSHFVGNSDTQDYFRFHLDSNSAFNLSLTGMSADADVQLLNSAGTEISASHHDGTADESTNLASLGKGDYYIRVYQKSGDTSYRLSLSNANPNNLLAVKTNLGTLSGLQTVNNDIGDRDTSDIYRFTLGNDNSALNLALTNLQGDANLQLIRDANQNGIIDADEILKSAIHTGTNDESINLSGLAAGDYYVQIYQGSGNTPYRLALSTDSINNLLAIKKDLGSLTNVSMEEDSVGDRDTSDIYHFKLTDSNSNLNARLTARSSDDKIQLSRDSNKDGIIQPEEVIASSIGNYHQAINLSGLAADDYYLQVYRTTSGNTDYKLALSTDNPSNLPLTEFYVDSLATPQTFNGKIDSGNTTDFYRVHLDDTSNFNLDLSLHYGERANVRLIHDVNGNGLFDDNTDELIAKEDEDSFYDRTLNLSNLAAGDYFVEVYQGASFNSADYTLKLSTDKPNNFLPINLQSQYDLGSLPSIGNPVTGSIDNGHAQHLYRFSVDKTSNLNLALTGLNNNTDAGMRLIQDTNGNSIGDDGDKIVSALQGNTTDKALNLSGLEAGNYFVQVYQNSGDTSYTLRLSDNQTNDLLSAETDIGTLSGTSVLSGKVDTSNTSDLFRFTADHSGIFGAALEGLSGDADVRLILDRNTNNVIDQGDIVAWQWERGNTPELIRRFLSSGNYFLQIVSHNNQTTDYKVVLGNFVQADNDDHRFSIQLQRGEGLNDSQWTTVEAAARNAANFWENVIPWSSFDSNQTLTIKVGGKDQDWDSTKHFGTLASGKWDNLSLDTTNHWLPTQAHLNVNTVADAYASLTSTTNDLEETLRHEIGHDLGIGSLWEKETYPDKNKSVVVGRNFVNRSNGTYAANTNAGLAYGEFLGTNQATAVPLETSLGDGSNYSHWQESTFTNELMTPQHNTPQPLGQITIAALRDLGWNVNYGAVEV